MIIHEFKECHPSALEATSDMLRFLDKDAEETINSLGRTTVALRNYLISHCKNASRITENLNAIILGLVYLKRIRKNALEGVKWL